MDKEAREQTTIRLLAKLNKWLRQNLERKGKPQHKKNVSRLPSIHYDLVINGNLTKSDCDDIVNKYMKELEMLSNPSID